MTTNNDKNQKNDNADSSSPVLEEGSFYRLNIPIFSRLAENAKELVPMREGDIITYLGVNFVYGNITETKWFHNNKTCLTASLDNHALNKGALDKIV